MKGTPLISFEPDSILFVHRNEELSLQFGFLLHVLAHCRDLYGDDLVSKACTFYLKKSFHHAK